MTTPALPPGFELDAAPPPLPPGFEMEGAPPPPSPRRSGAAAIPIGSNADGSDKFADQVPKAPPLAEPSLGEKGLRGIKAALGAHEATLTVLTALTGGSVGMASGFVRSLLGNLGAAAGVVQKPTKSLEQSMAEGAQELTYEPRLEAGKGYVEDVVNPAMQNLIPLIGAHGNVGAPGGVRGALRAAGDVTRAGTERAVDAITPEMSPQKVALASKAQQQGMQLQPHQLSENKIVRMAGEAAGHVPFAFGKGKANKAAFTKGVIKAIDPESTAEKLTPDVFAEAMDKAGGEIGDIAARTDVPIESFKVDDVGRKQTPDVRGVIDDYIADLHQVAGENDGIVPGDTLRRIRSEASAQSRTSSNGDLRAALGNLTKKLDDALAEHAPEGDMATLIEARRRYAIGKTLEPLVAKGDGDISPAALMGRVTSDRAGKSRMARGKGGELGEYARIGQQFLKEQASSGTAERNIIYRTATDAAAAAKAATAYPFAAAYNLLGPRVAKWMVERAKRKNAPEPEAPAGPPPEPTLEQGFEPQGGPQAPESPLGDMTPDWQTEPGAAPPGRPLEVVPTEGLVPAVGEATPMRVDAGEQPPAPVKNAGQDIPAVPGRPDLPDVMITGAPAEAAGDAATGAAMQVPEAVQARAQQTAPAASVDPRLAEVERLRAAAPTEAVRKVLDQHAKAIEKELKTASDAESLTKIAQQATDPQLRAALEREAAELRRPSKGESHAPLEITKQESVQQERGNRNEGRQATETGPGDSIQYAEKSKEVSAKEVGDEHLDLGLPSIDAAFMAEQRVLQALSKDAPAPASRGVAQVRRALVEGRDNGMLDKDGAALALWALDRNPRLAAGLRLTVEAKDPKSMAQGSYHAANEVVRLFEGKGAKHVDTAAHEILHHSERMMPEEIQRGIRREWQRALDRATRDAKGPTRAALLRVRRGLLAKTPEEITKAKDEMLEAFRSGALSKTDHYELVNPSEFWAVNASRILNERFTSRGTWRASARQWINEMVEHIKNTIGIRSDAAILKALDNILNPAENTGKRRSELMLSKSINRP